MEHMKISRSTSLFLVLALLLLLLLLLLLSLLLLLLLSLLPFLLGLVLLFLRPLASPFVPAAVRICATHACTHALARARPAPAARAQSKGGDALPDELDDCEDAGLRLPPASSLSSIPLCDFVFRALERTRQTPGQS